ncbi:pyridoxal 5'-phosphate synthase subunit PdxT-like isoform X2 [Zophobas morio]|uniref:pyridoxal 5'-phosphate synthase subunit PdxT-like isoform X2 n=1 Tax=Zophobas morio TaxID=2755281 RepID=UPI003082AAD1
MSEIREGLRIGILGLQGSYKAHEEMFKSLINSYTLSVSIIKSTSQLVEIDGLIIPGGESTSISLLCERSNLYEPLRNFVNEGNPVWGTCAGLVFLSKYVSQVKNGGQKFLESMDIKTERNYFGSQKDSFEGKETFSMSIYSGSCYHCCRSRQSRGLG